MKRRTIVKAAGLGLAGAFTGLPALAQDELGSKELVAAAEKEGGLTYYTANFAETGSNWFCGMMLPAKGVRTYDPLTKVCERGS